MEPQVVLLRKISKGIQVVVGTRGGRPGAANHSNYFKSVTFGPLPVFFQPICSNPELLIDQDNRIIEAVNITVNGGMGQGDVITEPVISVDDITNEAGIGNARFVTNAVSGPFAPQGVVSGSGGTVRARTTYDAITITNLSSKDLVMNTIEPAKATVSPIVEIDSQSVTLEFNISHDVAPTDIEIRNEGGSDIGLNGVINNPLGTTHLINTGGNIVNGGDLLPDIGTSGIVRANIIDTAAGGAIGSTASPEATLSERSDYDYGTNISGSNYMIFGHYTQVVWKNSKEVGCAMAVCSDKSQVWVCNYSPPGNISGQKPH